MGQGGAEVGVAGGLGHERLGEPHGTSRRLVGLPEPAGLPQHGREIAEGAGHVLAVFGDGGEVAHQGFAECQGLAVGLLGLREPAVGRVDEPWLE